MSRRRPGATPRPTTAAGWRSLQHPRTSPSYGDGGYTLCRCCGRDVLGVKLCSYCREAGCSSHGDAPRVGCGGEDDTNLGLCR